MTSFQLHNPTFNINNAFATLNNISWFRCYAGSWCLLDLFFFSICPVHREHCQSWLYTASRHLAAFRALPIIMLSMFCYPLTQNCMLPTDSITPSLYTLLLLIQCSFGFRYHNFHLQLKDFSDI